MSGSTETQVIRAEYSRRCDARRATLARSERCERVLADSRLVVFVAGLVMAWLAFGRGGLAAGWLAVPSVVFSGLIAGHERARRTSRRAARAATFYQRGLDRIDDCWTGAGEPGTRFLDLEHPYSADLDVFGPGSLFERLCLARTRAGESALAAWLTGPAPVSEVRDRQAAVAELRPRLDLREDVALLAADVRAGIAPDALAEWGRAPRVFRGRWLSVVAAALGVLAVAAVVAWLGFAYRWSPFLGVLVLEVLLTLAVSRRSQRVLEAVEQRTHDLVLLSALLARIEREPFESPALARVRAALETEGEPASARIARLARLLHLLETMKNQFFAPLGAVLMWPLQLTLAIDAWRGRTGPRIAGWLAAVGEFEALSSLSAYACENPADPFPELADEGAWFEAEGVGHPLLPEASSVRNDVRLGGATRVLAVSGSNMSGKSTLLRTVGANTVLALAGAPVRARRLRVAPMTIGATLRVQDSLQAGRSRFFAEITRIRQLVDLSNGRLPLLFLLDELFHGTNSHDRRVGAEAVVRGLIDRGAVGLVTTHDLALTEFAEGLAPRAVNVHFEDHFEDGTMHFDFRMRPGIVRKSNALELMRAVGLDV